MDLLRTNHVIPGLAYSADVTAGTMDVYSLANYRRITFFIMAGATNGDTSTVTVNANTSLSTSGGTAVAFKYRTLAAGANPPTSDTWGALTDATSSGIALTGTTYKCWALEITAEDLQAGLADAQYVYLAFADGGTAMTGSLFVVLSEPRFEGSAPTTAIA
jgi:hypothetical protein